MNAAKVAILVFAVVFVGAMDSAETRSSRKTEAQSSSFKSPCGTAKQLSARGGECLEPIFELIEGNFSTPNSDEDAKAACNRYNLSSRCVRQMAKDCLAGVQRTAVSAVATTARRFYVSECKTAEARAPYLDLLKCIRLNGAEIKRIHNHQTGVMQGIRDLPIPPEEKMVKMCCVLTDIDKEIAKFFDKACPKYKSTIIKMMHAITDDARKTLCLNPKCNGALEKVKSNKYKAPQNFAEPILEILYQM